MFAVAVCGRALLYLHLAEIQFDVNLHMCFVDQGLYLDFARKAHETRLHLTGDRNRMPLFPWILVVLSERAATVHGPK